jgi:POT family proton-dependent oligopeptide transporter
MALKDTAITTTDPDFRHEKGSDLHAVELPPVYEGKGTMTTDMVGEDFPTEEELHTLRRVADHIPWRVYTIAFIELCERFSYYGTTVVFTNFIQQPRDTPTGAATGPAGQAGALGMGQRASTGITTFNSFWVYCTPLLGAYIADK